MTTTGSDKRAILRKYFRINEEEEKFLQKLVKASITEQLPTIADREAESIVEKLISSPVDTDFDTTYHINLTITYSINHFVLEELLSTYRKDKKIMDQIKEEKGL